MLEVRDELGRTFKTLRISLINTCNLSCVYCTCGSDEIRHNTASAVERALSPKQLLSIISKLHRQLNLEVIRFTGGEPLLYPHLPEIVAGTKALGVKELKITTNGVLLETQVVALKHAGITSINVSLDAIDEEKFFLVSRRNNVNRILKGIDAAIESGLEVKLNAVIMKGMNEDQIIPLLNYAFDRNITIRFLEIMAMGYLHNKADKYFFSQGDVLEKISTYYSFNSLPRKAGSTANYWQTKTGNIFGIVANESAPFCGDCDRLRLDSEGNIYGCLSNNNPISIKDVETKEELSSKLFETLEQKQKVKFAGSELSMLHIGG